MEADAVGDPPLPPGQKRSLVAEEEEEEAEQHPTEPGENEDAAEDLESASSLASNASSIAFVAPEGASPHRSLPVETHRLIASFLPVPATLAVAACGRSLLGTYRRRFTALRLVTPKDSPVVAATTQASNTADGPALAPPSAIISSILRRQTQVQRLSLDFHPTQWAAPLAGVVDALREGERPDQQCLTGLEVGRVGGTDAQATATVRPLLQALRDGAWPGLSRLSLRQQPLGRHMLEALAATVDARAAAEPGTWLSELRVRVDVPPDEELSPWGGPVLVHEDHPLARLLFPGRRMPLKVLEFHDEYDYGATLPYSFFVLLCLLGMGGAGLERLILGPLRCGGIPASGQSLMDILGKGQLPSLLELEVTGWPLSDMAMQHLALWAQHPASASLQVLRIGNIGPEPAGHDGQEGAAAAGQADGEVGEDGGWLRLAEALSMGHGWARLTTLDLSGRRLGPSTARALAEAVRRDGVLPCLCDVTLSHNPLGDEGVAQLAEALGPALERIRLQRCGVGPEGARTLALALSGGTWPSLREMELGGNAMGDEGVTAVAEAAVRAGAVPELRMLGLQDNGATEEARRRVWQDLERQPDAGGDQQKRWRARVVRL